VKITVFYWISLILTISTLNIFCSKGGGSGGGNNCNGITTSVYATLVHPSSAAAADGSITASASPGTGFSFNINGGPYQTSGLFDHLPEGTYTIVARNSNGCSGLGNFTLTASTCPPNTIINVDGTFTNPTVPAGGNNGTINVTATGSVGFTYSINGSMYQTSPVFSNLSEGTYIVTVKDVNGCTGTLGFRLMLMAQGCNGYTITPTVSNLVNNDPCQGSPNGYFTINPTGATLPVMYSYMGGPFQSNNTFTNLANGYHSIVVKDANGCSAGISVTIKTLQPGTKFAIVKSLIQSHCVSCHSSVQAEGGKDFSNDCNIIFYQVRIKARAVDGLPTPMPPSGLLPIADRQNITSWITAGGRYSD